MTQIPKEKGRIVFQNKKEKERKKEGGENIMYVYR